MKKERKQNLSIAMLLALTMAVSFGIGTLISPASTTPIGDNLGFKGGTYCVCKNSATGECYEGMAGAECHHNTLTNAGKNATRAYLTTNWAGGKGNFTVLALSNVTPNFVDVLNFTQEMAGGLARGKASLLTYDANGNGNWSLVKTWTADGQFLSVNTTGVFNNTAAGLPTMLCGGTFTAVNLETSDTLTINYTLWVS